MPLSSAGLTRHAIFAALAVALSTYYVEAAAGIQRMSSCALAKTFGSLLLVFLLFTELFLSIQDVRVQWYTLPSALLIIAVAEVYSVATLKSINQSGYRC